MAPKKKRAKPKNQSGNKLKTKRIAKKSGSSSPTTGAERERDTGSSSPTTGAERERDTGSSSPTTGAERERDTGSSSPTGAVKEREGTSEVKQESWDREIQTPHKAAAASPVEGEVNQESNDQETPTPKKADVAQAASPWSAGSFAAVVKQADINQKLSRHTAEDIQKAALFARRSLLQPKISPNKSPTGLTQFTKLGAVATPNVKQPPIDRMAEAQLMAQHLKLKSFTQLNEENAKIKKAEEELLSDAYDFMTRFKKPGEENLKGSMCSGRVASMLRKGGKVLKLDFGLLLTNRYKKFALRVGKETDGRYSWLKPTLVKFLVEQGMTEDDAESVEVDFKNRPSSIQTVAEFMVNKDKIARDVQLLNGQSTVYAAATRGRATFRAHVEALFAKHDEGITFCGMLSLEDFLVVDEKRVVILADPVVPGKTEANPFGLSLPEDKCKDMSQIWILLSPFYTRKCANGLEELPQHFEDLRTELMEVKPAEVTTDRFKELIRCSFGLASCMAKAILRKGVYSITRRFGTAADPQLGDVFTSVLHSNLQDYKEDSKGSSVDAIQGVANYNDNISKLPNNPFGVLGIDRHVLEHGADYSKLEDMDEIELASSEEYQELYHPILKALIYNSDPQGKYASILSAYKAAAKNDCQDLPAGS